MGSGLILFVAAAFSVGFMAGAAVVWFAIAEAME